MATFVVCHGAWSASWAWKKMRPLMAALGHELFVPCYTGLGERAHLRCPDVTLDTHIEDVLAVFLMEDLSDVVLVGHSYGGMVATGVADRVRERVASLVYLDAFVPADGQSLFDLQEAEHVRLVRSCATVERGCCLVSPQPLPPDTPSEDVDWIIPRRMGHPLASFETPLRLTRGDFDGPRSYIFCMRVGPANAFAPFAAAARRSAGWRYLELDASHNPHVTAPEALMGLLDGIAAPSDA